MREVLARFNDQRIWIIGTVVRHGLHLRTNGRRFPTLLLGNVQSVGGAWLCEHCWVYHTATLQALALQPGDLLQCTARVRTYTKGYAGFSPLVHRANGIDYTFEHLDNCVCIYRAAEPGQETSYGDESG